MLTRRSFSRTLASLLMVPLLRMQPQTIDRHKLLASFCEVESYYRYDFTRPYIFDAFAYGSDGKAMARICADESEADEDAINLPPMQRAWELNYNPQTVWEPFQLYGISELHSYRNMGPSLCPVCDARRIPCYQDYRKFSGKEWVQYEIDGDDMTMNDPSCPQCHGFSDYSGPSLQPIGDYRISYFYAKKLSEIPALEVSVNPNGKDTSAGRRLNTVLFRSSIGIEGIVCCVNDL